MCLVWGLRGLGCVAILSACLVSACTTAELFAARIGCEASTSLLKQGNGVVEHESRVSLGLLQDTKAANKDKVAK